MEQTVKDIAREAKSRLKRGFWQDCKENLNEKMNEANIQGINKSRAGRYFVKEVSEKLFSPKEDDFYLKVKKLLSTEGEVSDAIGRLTDKAYYETLSYEEKQRYNLTLSEKYLRALERYRREQEFRSI